MPQQEARYSDPTSLFPLRWCNDDFTSRCMLSLNYSASPATCSSPSHWRFAGERPKDPLHRDLAIGPCLPLSSYFPALTRYTIHQQNDKRRPSLATHRQSSQRLVANGVSWLDGWLARHLEGCCLFGPVHGTALFPHRRRRDLMAGQSLKVVCDRSAEFSILVVVVCLSLSNVVVSSVDAGDL